MVMGLQLSEGRVVLEEEMARKKTQENINNKFQELQRAEIIEKTKQEEE